MTVTPLRKKPRISKQVMEKICLGLMEGKSLRSLCTAKDMPSHMSVYRHIREDEDAYVMYDSARQINAKPQRRNSAAGRSSAAR